MGAVEDINTYLASTAGGGTLGTEGTSIFEFAVVETTGRAVFTFEYPGAPPSQGYGSSGVFIENQRVQVLCRSTKPSVGAIAETNGARGLAHHVMRKLNRVVNTTLSGTTYLRIEPLQSPFFLDRDETGRVLFACNYEVQRRASTST